MVDENIFTSLNFFYRYTGGGREYIYFTEKITWNEAATYCQSIGGNLAIVDSAKFQHLLVKAFTDEYGSSPL